ncbi:hypothetical protein Poli38472_002811 [Pythium oligandrum]|uniref:Serine/threonine-protein kinase PLK n=1 Tax=Pythium oligandrum TaxID=41045 RepID=A0A8K1C5D9_PYTOL|nr:hypothetical protein Poli38472_002811 [Pythium oligandrum]|eukprot:TMW56886.1 hypothetical protein Poli38472_002811 [Pythium oligandrum]
MTPSTGRLFPQNRIDSSEAMTVATSELRQRRKSDGLVYVDAMPTRPETTDQNKENQENHATQTQNGADPTTVAKLQTTRTADPKRPLERIYEYVVDTKGAVNKYSYLKGRFLGKGGFATCYEAVCERTSRKYACKVVAKRSLTKPKAKTKFKSEIKIHKSLRHPNVVQFERYFEDEENAYMLLELCRNQSLSDLLRRRKRLSEAEVRFYIRQMIDGIAYLHKNLVIHRDLKLGNLFLTADMRLKIGDFGLAAQLDNPFDRKRTLCGTPNYIAPEILTGRSTTGHSFEVDIWSTGVVMYTLLVGRPPFETQDVKDTYKRIRASDYTFPENVDLSESAKSIIGSILRVDPHLRPSLNAILTHSFFQERPMPLSLPKTALLITPPECKRAIASNKRSAPSTSSAEYRSRPRSQQQPPRYPLRRRESPPVAPVTTQDQDTLPLVSRRSSETGSEKKVRMSVEDKPVSVRKQSSARLDASQSTTASSGSGSRPSDDERENPAAVKDGVKDPFEVVEETLTRFFYLEAHGSKEEKLSEYSSASVIVAAAKRVKEIRLEQEAAGLEALVPAKLWLSQWVDYTSKYGMGYVLSNGSAGVYFNDSTKIISSGDGMTLEYMERVPEATAQPEPFVRYPADMYDPSLGKKVTLLSHFQTYLIDEREKKPEIAAFEQEIDRFVIPDEKVTSSTKDDTDRMVFVKKWVKTKHAVLFCLSNHTFQFNFFDSSKLILSSNGRVVTYSDKDGKLGVYSTAVTILNREPSDLTKRLRYARDMFEQIGRVNATLQAQGSEE